MKFLFLFLFIFATFANYGQNITVEKIRLTGNYGRVSEIPKVTDPKNANNAVVEKINLQILDRFMITSFEQNEESIEEFHWSEVECSSELKNEILFIRFSGTYYGAYDNSVEDCLYFNLKTGEELQISEIQFQTLFTLSGYLDFINHYWLNGVKEEFKTAIECAGDEPYCSYYDIDYAVNENKLILSLNGDCYPRVSRACSPSYNLSVPLDSVKTYLSDVGKYILIESDYFSKSPIDKFIENRQLKEKIPDNIFFFGKIDNQYPISMAICIDKQNQISGYYYDDNKLKKMHLYGEQKGEEIRLTEELNGKITGFFELKMSKDYDNQGLFIMANSSDKNDQYLTGKWYDTKKTKPFDIEFTEAKTKNSWLWSCCCP